MPSVLCRCYFTTVKAQWLNEWSTATFPAWKADIVNGWPQAGQDMTGKSWWIEVPWGTFERTGLRNPTDDVFIRSVAVNEDTGTVLR